eukprot:TRINITY_DN34496_c0_g1_i1.p1 TRINITY_DN34496_c0_g1~~TRINITY_DN34496_c0_g1_i1.p1  ORF type:complete len:407 (-),score=62.71 TRINITY_DN34496_c0_g1_i1:70-1290(-)
MMLVLLSLFALFQGSISQLTCGDQVIVFSDIDDTLLYGTQPIPFPGGVLERAWTPNDPFKSGAYPGMVQFEIELERGPQNNFLSTLPPGVVVTTARPEAIGAIDETSTIGQVVTNGGLPLKDVLYGGLGVFKVPVSAMELGDEKISDMKEYAEDNDGKGYKYIFVGDNGQGDAYAAAALAADQANTCLEAAYIHDVRNSALTWPQSAPDFGELTLPSNVHLYQTAADAALLAYSNGHISRDGVIRIRAAILSSTEWQSCGNPCRCTTCSQNVVDAIAEPLNEVLELFEQIPFVDSDYTAALNAGRNSLAQYQQCLCEDCQASCATGLPPACAALGEDLSRMDTFLSSGQVPARQPSTGGALTNPPGEYCMDPVQPQPTPTTREQKVTVNFYNNVGGCASSGRTCKQ